MHILSSLISLRVNCDSMWHDIIIYNYVHAIKFVTQINWTLSDFFIDHPPPCGCGGFIPSQQSFNCSRDAVQQLKLKLKFWKLNRDLSNNLIANRCYKSQGCQRLNRLTWVNELNLNTSDPSESDVKRYLNCII